MSRYPGSVGNAAILLALIVGMVVVVLQSRARYSHATNLAETHTAIQCGHIVFGRAAQLRGVPLKKQDLGVLPARRNGVSLEELKSALANIGIPAELDFNPGLLESEFSGLVICKLHSPDHFVLIEDRDENSVTMFNETSHPVGVLKSSLAKRFKGYLLHLNDEAMPLRQRDKLEGGALPQFSTLWLDAGELDYNEYVDKNVRFEFPVVNVGDEPLQILDVSTSCDCTRADFPRDPIEPGASGMVTVFYHANVGDTDGRFRQELIVESNSRSFPFMQLQVTGAFPGRMTCLPKNLEFGVIRHSIATPRFVFVDVPIEYQGHENLAGRVVSDGGKPPAFAITRLTIAEFNARMRQLDASFVPVQPREGALVFELRPSPSGNIRSGHFLCRFEVYDSSGRLGTVGSNVRGFIVPEIDASTN